MQSKIKAGAIDEVSLYLETSAEASFQTRLLACINLLVSWILQYTKEVEMMLEVARSFIKSRTSAEAMENVAPPTPAIQETCWQKNFWSFRFFFGVNTKFSLCFFLVNHQVRFTGKSFSPYLHCREQVVWSCL